MSPCEEPVPRDLTSVPAVDESNELALVITGEGGNLTEPVVASTVVGARHDSRAGRETCHLRPHAASRERGERAPALEKCCCGEHGMHDDVRM